MSTVTTFVDKTSAVELLGTNMVKAQNTISFAETNCSSADVVQCLKVPAGAVVSKAYTIVTTAEGATATADLGDADDPNGYNDAANLNSTGAEFPVSGTDAYASGRYYSAADTIDLTLDHDMDAAIVKVVAEYSVVE